VVPGASPRASTARGRSLLRLTAYWVRDPVFLCSFLHLILGRSRLAVIYTRWWERVVQIGAHSKRPGPDARTQYGEDRDGFRRQRWRVDWYGGCHEFRSARSPSGPSSERGPRSVAVGKYLSGGSSSSSGGTIRSACRSLRRSGPHPQTRPRSSSTGTFGVGEHPCLSKSPATQPKSPSGFESIWGDDPLGLSRLGTKPAPDKPVTEERPRGSRSGSRGRLTAVARAGRYTSSRRRSEEPALSQQPEPRDLGDFDSTSPFAKPDLTHGTVLKTAVLKTRSC